MHLEPTFQTQLNILKNRMYTEYLEDTKCLQLQNEYSSCMNTYGERVYAVRLALTLLIRKLIHSVFKHTVQEMPSRITGVPLHCLTQFYEQWVTSTLHRIMGNGMHALQSQCGQVTL